MHVKTGMVALFCASMIALAGCDQGGLVSYTIMTQTPATASASSPTTSPPAPTGTPPATAGVSKTVPWPVVSCTSLKGSGTGLDPYQIGAVGGPVSIRDCPVGVTGVVDSYLSFTRPFSC